MKKITIKIDERVFAQFSRIGIAGFVVSALAVNPTLVEIAQQDVFAAYNALSISIQNIVDEPRIKGWREIFAACGLKPSTYKSSAEQLARRFLKGEIISTPVVSVNLYCGISARHLAPIGGYDVQKISADPICLRYVNPECDRFIPLGGALKDMPLSASTVAYTMDDEIICTSFNFRDSKTTSLDSDTRSALFLSEFTNPAQRSATTEALMALSLALEESGSLVGPVEFADASKPQISLSLAI